MRIPTFLAVAALVAAPLLFSAGTASAAAAAPPLVITPNPASPGDTVTFSGAGCFGKDSAPAQVTIDVIDAKVPVPDHAPKKLSASDDEGDPIITPKPDGTWSYSTPLPDEYPSVAITFGAVCDSYTGSFQYAPTTLTVDGNLDATFLILPDFLDGTPVLDAGKSYELDAFGFKPGEKVDLILHSTPVQIATFVVAGDSSVTGRFTIPIDTLGGDHTLDMLGEDSGLTADLPVEVIAAPVSPTVTATVIASTTVVSTLSTTPQDNGGGHPTTTVIAGPVLASTGTAALPQMTGVGVALTLGGIGTLLFARRRRSRSH